MKKLTRLLGVLAVAAVAIPLAACSSSGSTAAAKNADGDSGTISWWTWDNNETYKACLPGFEKKYPDIKVNISEYSTSDYFTKLAADFVAGNAPDTFQNSVQYLDAFASQGQLEPLDSYIKKSGFDMGVFDGVGTKTFTYSDGKQYALPIDWSGSAFFYNEDMIKQAGLTDQQMQTMNWNPTNGGTFDKIVAHLTVDKNGVRGDQPGFDKNNVAVYGIGNIIADDFIGQTSWYQFAASSNWTLGTPASWPTQFNYNDPTFIKVQDYLKSLVTRGFAPAMGQFTIADTDQLGSGKVAMTSSGSWSASTFAKLPGVKIGTAPDVIGTSGTRAVMSGSNGNMIWAGSKHKQAAWDWVSYLGTAACQTTAAESNGSFFPSIPSAMTKFVSYEQSQGLDLSVFSGYEKNNELQPLLPYKNGIALGSDIQPLFDAFYANKKGNEVWKTAQDTSKKDLAAK